MADLLGGRPEEIAFGLNMTSLTFAHFARVWRGTGQRWRQSGRYPARPRREHRPLACGRGLIAAWRCAGSTSIRTPAACGTMPCRDLLDARTRLVAVGAASNALGTLNDVPAVAASVRAHSAGAAFCRRGTVSATRRGRRDVHLAATCWPAPPINPLARARVCSGAVPSYWSGSKRTRYAPAGNRNGAHRFETGTPSFEGQAGVLGTIDYLEWLGREIDPTANSRRSRLLAAMTASVGLRTRAWASGCSLASRAFLGLRLIRSADDGRARPDLRLHACRSRLPTAVARHLASARHLRLVRTLLRCGGDPPPCDWRDQGGLVRVGLCHYSTADEVDRLISALEEFQT